jgi:Arc/MetJ family transcription regulator
MVETMKTNIEVDDALIADALQATGLDTIDKVIELALKTLLQIKR